MGFSLIASAVILGVAVAMGVQILAAEVFPRLDEVGEAYAGLKGRVDDAAHTAFEITEVVRSANGSVFDYTLSLTNTGSITLDSGSFTVLVDGVNTAFTASGAYVHPEASVTLSVVGVAGGGTIRFKVIAANGACDYALSPP
jgi:archaellum component FlaF (FlaF/FlaG flagellin family)